MAFPTTPILDDFNRSDGAIGSNWTSPALQSADVAPTILTNVAIGGASAYGSAYWNPETFGPDSEVYMTIAAAASSWTNGQLTCRAQDINTASQDEYQLVISSTNGLDVYRTINDSQSAVLLALDDILGAGDSVGMCVKTQGDDNLIEIWTETGSGWTEVGNVVDTGANTSFPVIANAGYIAFSVFGNSAITRSIDNFGGGTVVTTPPEPTDIYLMPMRMI